MVHQKEFISCTCVHLWSSSSSFLCIYESQRGRRVWDQGAEDGRCPWRSGASRGLEALRLTFLAFLNCDIPDGCENGERSCLMQITIPNIFQGSSLLLQKGMSAVLCAHKNLLAVSLSERRSVSWLVRTGTGGQCVRRRYGVVH